MTSTESPGPDEPAGPPEPPEPVFAAIDHVGIAVQDYESALALYRDVYGMRVVHEEINAEQGVREAMLEVGPAGGPLIQLLAPLHENSPVARFLARRGPGLQQLAFRVDDVGRAAEQVRRHGLRTLEDEPARGTAGSSIMFLHPKDAGGVLVELVQPARAAEVSRDAAASRDAQSARRGDSGDGPAPNG